MKKTGIGFVGVGCISGIYLKNITEVFRDIELVGVCDLIPERSKEAADTYHCKVYRDMYELFDDPDVDIVLNITRPYEHYEVTKQALLHGKNVYSEKPLSPNLEEARELVTLAADRGLTLGGAPDTFMGAGIQTARHLIDSGFIGTPIGASARMISRGPECWHPDPEFLFGYGGGPMFDMGPYYVTALINLLGAVESVSGMASISYPERIITSDKKYGNVIQVEAPTYVTGTLRFKNGAIGSLFTTFDVSYGSPELNSNSIEIYGSEGTLFVPDPNTFGGRIRLIRGRESEIKDLPLIYPYTQNSRGLGLADMAKALNSGRRHRANESQQFHVVEIMSAFYTSNNSGKNIKILSSFDRQPQMKRDTLYGVLDD